MGVGLLGEPDQPGFDRGAVGRGGHVGLAQDVPGREQGVHRVDHAAGVGPARLGDQPGIRLGVPAQRGDVALREGRVIGEEDIVGADVERAREVPRRLVAVAAALHRRERRADQRSEIDEVLLADADPLAVPAAGAAVILAELGAAALDVEQRLGVGDAGAIEERLLAGGRAAGHEEAEKRRRERSGPRHRWSFPPEAPGV